jgi:uncharacterized protein (TIGR02757 family)
MRLNKPVKQEILRDRLDQLVATFDVSTITPDPLELVLRYRDPLDQEIAGLLAAAFAYGRADIVVANIGRVLDAMTCGAGSLTRPDGSEDPSHVSSPYAYIVAFRRKEAEVRFARFAHRFQKMPELVALLECIAKAVKKHGSLGALFRKCYVDKDEDIGPALTRFVEALVGTQSRNRATAYLLTSPADGSACKRLNLYLRWMVRRTSPDLGLWTFVDPAKLVMPLDTHIHRIATFLGLGSRKSADWKAARAITDRLAKFNPEDPVRYDFALCRLGILDLCSRRRRKENCDVCLLRDVCRFPVT